ncbi:hypothetical protein [Campylobacter californiensis]|uniref:hypothetical protein n=1 Tax=Campylobacter californiensis TaxID=1032243 RepID=UPI0014734AED|nr:hypothetical protein [Campylobacter sp. RM12916]MBE3610515.1 hypothetical protein [Campylobacter sp. RM12916]
MIDPVDYEFIKNEQRQNEISRYCKEYEEKVNTLLETISRKLKALREEYEPYDRGLKFKPLAFETAVAHFV